MKLYVRAPLSTKRLNQLETMFREVVYEPWTITGERYYEDEMIEALKKHAPDVLITELDKITDKVLSSYTNLKAIGDCRAVPANIDVDACTKHGIPVICTPARNAQAVAEMLVGLLIAYMRNVIDSVKWATDGSWVEGTTPYYLWMGNELQGKKIGFIGFGAVGQRAAKILDAFGCHIYFYDPYVNVAEEGYIKQELDEIFKNSDIISIHLPVLESTIKLIGKELLSTMKKDAIFVNTARTAVVDNSALKEILENKGIKGAILDVLETEPPTLEDLEIGKLPNVLLTPHICGATYEVTDHQSDIITERIRKWKNGELEQVVFNKNVLAR